MQYDLSIPPENKQFHVDMEGDIAQKKDGLFTFVIRVHNGKITDYSLMEYVDAKTKYRCFATVSVEKLVVSRPY